MPVKLFEIITATAQEQSAQVAMSITRKNARDTTIEAMEEITKEVVIIVEMGGGVVVAAMAVATVANTAVAVDTNREVIMDPEAIKADKVIITHIEEAVEVEEAIDRISRTAAVMVVVTALARMVPQVAMVRITVLMEAVMVLEATAQVAQEVIIIVTIKVRVIVVVQTQIQATGVRDSTAVVGHMVVNQIRINNGAVQTVVGVATTTTIIVEVEAVTVEVVTVTKKLCPEKNSTWNNS